MPSKFRIIVALLGSLVACSESTLPTPRAVFDFAFADDVQGWVADFADYPLGSETFHEQTSGYQQLPAPLNARSGFYISGNNHSADLFMYLRRHVTGLEPNTSYQVTFVVEFATDAPAGCFGPGSIGESVVVKAGASAIEPASVVDQFGDLRMSIDKGEQSQSGVNAVVIGNVASSTLCEENIRRYEIKELRSPPAVAVTTDGAGSAWLVVGTDSGFEGVTSLYYTRMTATFSR